jgi:fructose-1-phosphate kinase PfkB-like protein
MQTESLHSVTPALQSASKTVGAGDPLVAKALAQHRQFG